MRYLQTLALTLALIIPPLSHGKGREASSSGSGPEVHMIQLDPDFPIEDLEAPGIRTHRLSDVAERPSETLPFQQRERLLQAAGLSEAMRGWDAFEKDILFLKLEHAPFPRVAEEYKERIPEASLRILRSNLLEYRQQESAAR